MSGGPLFPFSEYLGGASGRLFHNFHQGGTNGRSDEGVGVEASLSADSTLELRFQMPPSLPSGTAKLLMRALANATSGDAKVNPKWVSVADAENPDTATLNAEGTQTLTWASGEADDYKEAKVTLDADTTVAGEIVVMHVVFETTSWDLAAVSTWQFSIIWE